MRALVIGGTGPTGPFIVNGLLKRGYEVAILHRGKHEVDEIPHEVEHIHVDPNFEETLASGLEGRMFDLCIATYGRLRLVAEALVGKADRIISVGGYGYGGIFVPQTKFPSGELVPIQESSSFITSKEEHAFGFQMSATESRVFELYPAATHFRYPYVYGAYQIVPHEWHIVRRLLDKRRFILALDGGLALHPRGYAENVAEAVLLSVDHREASAGRIFNCGDERQLSLRQMIETIADEMDTDVEIVSVPSSVGRLARPLMMGETLQSIVLDLHTLKTELGYRDVVDPVEGLRRTARWLLQHPPERGGQTERMLGDQFDYVSEDRFLDVYRGCLDMLKEFAWDGTARIHPYPHPKKLGQEDHHGR